MATRRNPAKKSQEIALSVTLPGGVEFGCSRPTQDVWDGYLTHLIDGHDTVAHRELVQRTVCTHTIPEAKKILARYTGLPKSFCDKVDDLIGGDLKPDVDQVKGLISFELNGSQFTMTPPSQQQWDESQEPKSGQKFGPVMREFLSTLVDQPQLFLAALEEYPAALGPIVKAVGEIAGAELEVTVKKE